MPKYYIPESRFNDDMRRQMAEQQAFNMSMNDPAAFYQRRQANLNAERQFQLQRHGDFAQNAALQRELQGTFADRAGENRALQGTYAERSANDRLIHGTLAEREAGLNQRQQAQFAADLGRTKLTEEGATARAQLADTGAMNRLKLSEEGATNRAQMAQEGENWRRTYEPTHYSQETAVDAMGNVIHRTVPYQYGKPVNQPQANITGQVAPSGYKDVDHFLSVYNNLPQNQKAQFLTETQQYKPDMLVQARNKTANSLKAKTSTQAVANVPETTGTPVASARPVAETTPYVGTYKRDIQSPLTLPETTGGDTNRMIFRKPSGPAYSPPDTSSYITQGEPEQNLQPGATPTVQGPARYPMPTPSTYAEPIVKPMPETPARYPMPTPANYGEPLRHSMPETPALPETASESPPAPISLEMPQSYSPGGGASRAIANLRSEIEQPSSFQRYLNSKRARSSLIFS